MNARTNSLLFLHTAVFLFGGTAVFARAIKLPALDITCYRAAIACLVLLFVVRLSGAKIRLSNWRDYRTAVVLGVVVGLHWVTYFAGMQYAGVAIGIIAFFTYPVMTVLLEPVLMKQRPKRQDLVSTLAVIAGVVLIVPELSFSNQTTLGILLGVVSAFLFTIRNIVHKRRFSQYSGPQAMFYQTLVASTMLVPFLSTTPLQADSDTLWLLLLLGCMFTAAPHALMASSLRELKAKTVGLISCLQPMYGMAMAALLLNEWPDVQTLIGGTLVLSAAIFETAYGHKQG